MGLGFWSLNFVILEAKVESESLQKRMTPLLSVLILLFVLDADGQSPGMPTCKLSQPHC